MHAVTLWRCCAAQDNLHYVQQGEANSVDRAAANYLEFLKEGRSVILEDTGILQDQDPGHRIFKLPCFQLPIEGRPASPLQRIWAEYKAEVLAAHARSIGDNLQVHTSYLFQHAFAQHMGIDSVTFWVVYSLPARLATALLSDL